MVSFATSNKIHLKSVKIWLSKEKKLCSASYWKKSHDHLFKLKLLLLSIILYHNIHIRSGFQNCNQNNKMWQKVFSCCVRVSVWSCETEEKASCCVMSVDHQGGLCDRWRGWLEETERWWWGHLCLTVACCFSAFSFASSSCFCRAAWRDFISSLSSGREVRNTLLAHRPYTLRALYYTTSEWFSKAHSFERK